MKDTMIMRNMQRPEVDVLVNWAAQEGWNPGVHDAEAFWQADSEAFIAALVQENMIGGGSVTSYEGKYGFMGFFIVKPEYRGLGFGRKLWYHRRQRMLERLSPGASVGLDAAFQMQDFYGEGGFEFSHRNLRFSMDKPLSKANNSASEYEICPLADIPFDQLLQYDLTCFPACREKFLRTWLSPEGVQALGLMQSGELCGYGVIRRCADGYKVGPLFANSGELAEALLRELSSSVEVGPIFLDVPENNPEAMALVKKYNMKEVFGCARMYLGPKPDIANERVFGVTTFELG
ncbi:GNAT family N-acetyltransferase [Microbulbifer sp. THAF38]|uniref:GNAT family N-acetyltransferase n=1 Tax=Microbulbifer sp. THAF38 TaxID=2587856 RepID=UPI0012689C1B|nr:GNAT family N-acetyltransferase [Microbulbifer sp. THAF38]QFT54299.1 putative acetyltransferase [Microbulbifer sp. THAF38]